MVHRYIARRWSDKFDEGNKPACGIYYPRAGSGSDYTQTSPFSKGDRNVTVMEKGMVDPLPSRANHKHVQYTIKKRIQSKLVRLGRIRIRIVTDAQFLGTLSRIVDHNLPQKSILF